MFAKRAAGSIEIERLEPFDAPGSGNIPAEKPGNP
jgi:hypothetical protein